MWTRRWSVEFRARRGLQDYQFPKAVKKLLRKPTRVPAAIWAPLNGDYEEHDLGCKAVSYARRLLLLGFIF
jgi:hypothetical protein